MIKDDDDDDDDNGIHNSDGDDLLHYLNNTLVAILSYPLHSIKMYF